MSDEVNIVQGLEIGGDDYIRPLVRDKIINHRMVLCSQIKDWKANKSYPSTPGCWFVDGSGFAGNAPILLWVGNELYNLDYLLD